MPRLPRSAELMAGVLLLLLFVYAHPTLADSPPSPIRIGEIDPLTGRLAQHGLEIHEGILYAVEETNAAGGIGSRQVELVSRDDQSQPEVAINQAEELLFSEKVVGLVGGYVDSLVGPVSEMAAKHRVPYVASASLQRELTRGRKNPFFFRVSHLEGIVDPLCGFVIDSLRPQRVGILFSATPGSTEFGREVRACLEKAGISVPLFEKFRPGSPDLSGFLFKARRSNVDVLLSGGFFPDHLILIRQMREQRVPIRAYLGPWGIAYPSFIQTMGDTGEHMLGMCAWNPGIAVPGTEKASDAFVQGFLKRFGKLPNTTTMHGYTSAKALVAAMERVVAHGTSFTGDSICRELAQLDLLLPMERLQFNEKGDPRHYRQLVVQIQDGQLVPVYPPDRARGKPIYPMHLE